MKKLIFLFLLIPVASFSAAPSTSCPSGYIAIDTPSITVATTCPSGTVSVGTAESCLGDSPSGNCIMYAPAGVTYTDGVGAYEFAYACPMS